MLILGISILIFIALVYVTYDDNLKIIKRIKKNYAPINLYYVNRYDDYYIFISDKNYGVLDKKYNEVLLVEKKNLCKKKKNYDIIYRKDEIMYLEEKVKKNKLTFNYYDINDCKLIESISVGG